MKIYIRATGNISPQPTFGQEGLPLELAEYAGNRLNCIEPDYRQYIDAKQIRRMSRIIKMGVASAMECLQKAGVEVPDAIITGTAYGCLEDTGVFLSRMIEQKEELLAPTAFIQSTHNTVGAQIALLLQCRGYNNVFVHRGFSFESALLDAMLMLKENEAGNILVGGLDEITQSSHIILTRFGLYKGNSPSNLRLYSQASKGTIAGEGAAFFLLTNQISGKRGIMLEAVSTFYKPAGIREIESRINAFIKEQGVSYSDIDLVITGRNGDKDTDQVFSELDKTLFNEKCTMNYKHLCGEYPTSIAFGLWLAVCILREGSIPEVYTPRGDKGRKIRRVLIYNHMNISHHSLLMLSAC